MHRPPGKWNQTTEQICALKWVWVTEFQHSLRLNALFDIVWDEEQSSLTAINTRQQCPCLSQPLSSTLCCLSADQTQSLRRETSGFIQIKVYSPVKKLSSPQFFRRRIGFLQDSQAHRILKLALLAERDDCGQAIMDLQALTSYEESLYEPLSWKLGKRLSFTLRTSRLTTCIAFLDPTVYPYKLVGPSRSNNSSKFVIYDYVINIKLLNRLK